MGKHYVPQEYLRGFLTNRDRDQLWMYDRAEQEWSLAAIKHVAQQRDYYSPEVENELTAQVEVPGNAALRQLRASIDLDGPARMSLAVYISVMHTRGPRKRRKGREIAPALFHEMLADTRADLSKL
ncbi:MAG TPA: DUF4238 domain-containing protein, partial [Gemmatimonadaceae bacterium]|nr:DUF4238 domain-containing protein [Gemmatimonadaceae bacterium]